VVILEEAAFMDQQVFMTVCVPLIGVNHTAIIGITTPDNEFNYCSELIDLKTVGGEPLFNVNQIGLQCPSCKMRNRPCTHPVVVMPHWKSIGNQEKQQAIMASDPELMMRETRGVTMSKRQFIFKPYLRSFKERAAHEFTYDVPYAAIGIDPASGSSSSQYSISTVTSSDGRYPIMGIDASSSVDRNVVFKMVGDHVKSMRQHRQYAHTYFFVFIEANLNFMEAGALAKMLENEEEYGPLKCIRFDPGDTGRVGVWTSATDKQLYATDLLRALSDGQLCRAHVMGGDPATKEKNWKELLVQLDRFHRDVKEAKDHVYGTNKITWTAKGGPGKWDDIVLALMIAHTNLTRFKRTEEFMRIADERGWPL
jgi:hypothetical protein